MPITKLADNMLGIATGAHNFNTFRDSAAQVPESNYAIGHALGSGAFAGGALGYLGGNAWFNSATKDHRRELMEDLIGTGNKKESVSKYLNNTKNLRRIRKGIRVAAPLLGMAGAYQMYKNRNAGAE